MKQYKVTIANGNYPLIYTCDTIADAYECLRMLGSWMPKITFEPKDFDALMEDLVHMRNGALLKSACSTYSVTVLEEADADADLD